MSFFVGGTINEAILYLYVDASNADLVSEYRMQVEKHNNAVKTDPYPNSGFDLLCPTTEEFTSMSAKFVDYRIKTEMRIYNIESQSWKSTGFFVYPRSSMSKTPLMLANHTGIIDSGYRGWIMGAFRFLGQENATYMVEKSNRLLQICAPDLRPILVKMVHEDFFQSTSRGEGGFGSTGI
jgi:dUTPase